MQQHAFITAVKLGSPERLLAFCGAVQRCSPVGAFVEPVPGAAWGAFSGNLGHVGPVSGMVVAGLRSYVGFQGPCLSAEPGPILAQNREMMRSSGLAVASAGATAGYSDEVVFANGTFIDGSTAELSADGPLRPPFAVYCQARARL